MVSECHPIFPPRHCLIHQLWHHSCDHRTPHHCSMANEAKGDQFDSLGKSRVCLGIINRIEILMLILIWGKMWIKPTVYPKLFDYLYIHTFCMRSSCLMYHWIISHLSCVTIIEARLCRGASVRMNHRLDVPSHILGEIYPARAGKEKHHETSAYFKRVSMIRVYSVTQ